MGADNLDQDKRLKEEKKNAKVQRTDLEIFVPLRFCGLLLFAKESLLLAAVRMNFALNNNNGMSMKEIRPFRAKEFSLG